MNKDNNLHMIFQNIKTTSFLIGKLIIGITLIILIYYAPIDFFGSDMMKSLLIMFLIYVGLNLITTILTDISIYVYKKKHKFSNKHQDNFMIGIKRLGLVLFNIVFLIILLMRFGTDLGGFLTSMSIFAVAIVNSFKPQIHNFISGMAIMFSNDFKLREYIMIGEQKGRITDITFSNVKIQTETGNVIYIPNSKFSSADIKNYSKRKTKTIKYPFTLNIDEYEKFNKYKTKIINNLEKEFKEILSIQNIKLRITEIDKDIVSLNVEILTTRYNFKIENQVKDFLSKELIEFFSTSNKKTKVKN